MLRLFRELKERWDFNSPSNLHNRTFIAERTLNGIDRYACVIGVAGKL